MANVRRFREPLTQSGLLEVLRGEQRATERLDSDVSLEPLDDAIASLASNAAGSSIDGALVEPVHQALGSLTRAEAADMRVWHWLCAVQFPSLVWRRWRQAGPPEDHELDGALTDSMARRFLGTSSLAGVSRNTLARLWWTAENLEGDYHLARQALSRQDMFQAIFERLFGLHPAAAKAAIAAFDGRSEDEVRRAARWLNYAGATAVLEALSEADIRAILDESLGAPTR
jgi:hypothetical protein